MFAWFFGVACDLLINFSSKYSFACVYAYLPTKKVHKYYFDILLRDGMEISENNKEDVLSVCFISIIIILLLVIQVTGAI